MNKSSPGNLPPAMTSLSAANIVSSWFANGFGQDIEEDSHDDLCLLRLWHLFR